MSLFHGPAGVGWRKSAGIDGGGPYSVWKTPDDLPWWTVLDRNGLNVLTNGTGQVFTDEEEAKRLCSNWNYGLRERYVWCNDLLGNALFREKTLAAQLEFWKKFGRGEYS